MDIVQVPQLAWYGAKDLALPFPDDWQVEFYNMAGYDRPAMKPGEIKAALSNPIGVLPIRELARGKKEVVIIFDDMTRVTKTAMVVPHVLEELAAAGIPDSRVRFVMAVGAHGASNRLDFVKKLGEEVLARFPVYNHNAFGNCTYVGTTSRGTRICVNEEVMKCDLKIAIGAVVPHPDAGFSGGGKIILPGVSSVETIEHFHQQEFILKEKYPDKIITGMGFFDENQLRLNIAEAAELAGLDFKIDCILNAMGDTVAIFAGAVQPAHMAAISDARANYLTPRARGEDIIIANTFVKANESMMVGLFTAFSSTDRDVDVVLISNAPDGQVTHYLMGFFGRTTSGSLKLQMQIPEHVKRLIVYSEYPDIAGGQYVEESDKVSFTSDWDSTLKVLAGRHGDGTRVAIYPNPEMQYFGDLS